MANTFTVTITTHSVGEVCTAALVAFAENIPLDVNGITGTFELAVDNLIPVQ